MNFDPLSDDDRYVIRIDSNINKAHRVIARQTSCENTLTSASASNFEGAVKTSFSVRYAPQFAEHRTRAQLKIVNGTKSERNGH